MPKWARWAKANTRRGGEGEEEEGEEEEERGALSLQNEDPTPQDGWEKDTMCPRHHYRVDVDDHQCLRHQLTTAKTFNITNKPTPILSNITPYCKYCKHDGHCQTSQHRHDLQTTNTSATTTEIHHSNVCTEWCCRTSRVRLRCYVIQEHR